MEQQAWNVVGLAAGIGGMVQSRKLHKVELEHSVERHKESVSLAKEQHDNDMKTTKQTYLLELFNSLEQHFQQLNADLMASSRESERDMFDQRNQSFQTVILSSSVMFSGLATILLNGVLPNRTSSWLLVSYALTSSLSFLFLFVCMVICIELVIRTSQFMYTRGLRHTASLQMAIKDTKKMMRDLRGESSFVNGLGETRERAVTLESLQKDIAGAKAIQRAIARMQAGEIDNEFERHEVEIRNYLKKRDDLNDSSAVTLYRDETGEKRPFKHFWESSCQSWWDLAILLFYGGSMNTILALMVYMWAQFLIAYSSLLAAIIGVSLLGAVLVLGVGIVIVMRQVDREEDRRDEITLNDLKLGAFAINRQNSMGQNTGQMANPQSVVPDQAAFEGARGGRAPAAAPQSSSTASTASPTSTQGTHQTHPRKSESSGEANAGEQPAVDIESPAISEITVSPSLTTTGLDTSRRRRFLGLSPFRPRRPSRLGEQSLAQTQSLNPES
eukprot:CAMPEP_0173175788 /NCGR_PEP_ID=MMETSP1141-20130122/4101_1 /TAXON_ID=483371 /ORGANISM="non described non described, Strain CCMP2298" /LENGTH=500 /DNA_ID=CAMNT_0014098059 /DNA_START=84 /DNA_END=1586 /DNA_ORIENTATION=+